MTTVRVKICCIASREEARTAIDLGASALGMVSEMPSGPGVIPESLIAEIAAGLPPAVGSFLLTSMVDGAAIVAQQRRCRVNTMQLCDLVPAGVYRALREGMPGVSIVQVVHVRDEGALDEAVRAAPAVDAVLLDSGNPALATKELGGTGRTHDWDISRRIRDRVGVPVFLAGGLHAGNVGEAIRRVRPFAVDVCSGVRTGGSLDPVKLRAFMDAVCAWDA